MSFSRCVHKGDKLELAGREPFLELTLPLSKAIDYFQRSHSPPKTAVYFDCHMTLGIGVLEAPMVGVIASELSEELALTPWVRVIRHEAGQAELPRWHPTRDKFFAIEIVHKDFLQDYLDNHLLPFYKRFSERVNRHQDCLASGKGFAGQMERYWSFDLERRLKPISVKKKMSHLKAIIRQITRVLTMRYN
jgi:hypothetical protein